MWDGPGQGPRGGPPFRGGDHRGDMFGGREGPMPDFRGRDGMNMGPMGPPMDMRRMDGPSMRGRDMEPRDMRGREPNRDFCRPGEEPDFSLRRQYEISIREKLISSSGFMGPGRNSDTGGRGMPPREPNNRFMDMRDREALRYDMPGFNNPNMDGRRGFPLDPMERNDGFRDMRDRPPRDMDDIDGCNMDIPPRDRRMMDVDRRGGAPFNARGGFESDTDFRNRPGPSAEFRGRERSPLRFGSDISPTDRGRSDMPSDGPQRPGRMVAEDTCRDRDFSESRDSPLMDYRSGEEMTLAEEWKKRQKEKNPFPNVTKAMGGVADKSLPLGFGRGGLAGDPSPFKERDRPPAEFSGKVVGFPRGGHFAAMDPLAAIEPPSIGRKPPQDRPQDRPLPDMSPHTGPPGRDNESKHWLGVRDPKHSRNASSLDERPAYHQEKSQPSQEMKKPSDCFKGPKDMPHDQGAVRSKMDFQSSSTVQGRDQDYRDIDYRTGGRAFDYKREDFQAPEKALKEAKPIPPSKFTDSGSQDQDYRSASVEDKVSNTISILGIPKTATMEQILGAFAVRDGVPMQGMKIKSVVPGYSYDTAYVEFLNLEDAVHFMESNKGSLKVGTKTASMKYIQPDKSERTAPAPESDPKVPKPQDPLLPSLDEPLEKLKSSLNGSNDKPPLEPLPLGQWQRSSDLTPEAWQQQVDQQLQQQEPEPQAEPWASRNPPHHGPHQTDPVFKDSKTMIIKNVKPTTTVDTILKALDPFAYLDERNVRLVKGKTPGAKCFCFVDMDSHEQVTRLVELLTKPRPLSVDGVRVYAEVAKPLKNQNFRREFDKPNSSLLGFPPDANMLGPQQQPYPPSLQLPYSQSLPPPGGTSAGMQGDLMAGNVNPSLSSDSTYSQGAGYGETPSVDPSYQAPGSQAYQAAGSQAYQAPGSQTYQAPGSQAYQAPGSQTYQAPGSQTYQAPGSQAYQAPGSQAYQAPGSQAYQAAGAPAGGPQAPAEPAAMTAAADGTEIYIYGSETPDISSYLFDATSGFYYDPATTLYYDPSSRYFYNAQTQEYLYWDATTKTYIPVPGSTSAETQPVAMTAEVQAILANPAADAPLEMKKPSEPKPAPAVVPTLAPHPTSPPTVTLGSAPNPTPESVPTPPSTPEKREDDDDSKKDKDGKEEKPRSLAAVKIMKDMERWAKIQNRQKDSVRSPSPLLKTGGLEDRKSSKAADAAFAIFASKGSVGDDLFKKPLAPPSSKREDKGKRLMGSLGLVSDYGAGSDEEVEEEKQETPKSSKSQSDDKDDKLTDWKKMACLLCRRQFPNKDALVRHQQLSDLHKQNMEIHLKIKKSKKELEALENQEKEMNAREAPKSEAPRSEVVRSPEQKRRKHHHQQQQPNTWAAGSRDKVSERPGLGSEPVVRKKKEPVVWDHATYKQAVRKAMFARFKELE